MKPSARWPVIATSVTLESTSAGLDSDVVLPVHSWPKLFLQGREGCQRGAHSLSAKHEMRAGSCRTQLQAQHAKWKGVGALCKKGPHPPAYSSPPCSRGPIRWPCSSPPRLYLDFTHAPKQYKSPPVLSFLAVVRKQVLPGPGADPACPAVATFWMVCPMPPWNRAGPAELNSPYAAVLPNPS